MKAPKEHVIVGRTANFGIHSVISDIGIMDGQTVFEAMYLVAIYFDEEESFMEWALDQECGALNSAIKIDEYMINLIIDISGNTFSP